jgi:hypothetical protein
MRNQARVKMISTQHQYRERQNRFVCAHRWFLRWLRMEIYSLVRISRRLSNSNVWRNHRASCFLSFSEQIASTSIGRSTESSKPCNIWQVESRSEKSVGNRFGTFILNLEVAFNWSKVLTQLKIWKSFQETNLTRNGQNWIRIYCNCCKESTYVSTPTRCTKGKAPWSINSTYQSIIS